MPSPIAIQPANDAIQPENEMHVGTPNPRHPKPAVKDDAERRRQARPWDAKRTRYIRPYPAQQQYARADCDKRAHRADVDDR